MLGTDDFHRLQSTGYALGATPGGQLLVLLAVAAVDLLVQALGTAARGCVLEHADQASSVLTT
jgi:hypothetical protein